MTTDELLSFGPFMLDPDTLELRREGARVPLEPLPARLLERLARNAGSLVPRRELVALGWPGSLPSVAEQSLNTCMYQIRRALDAGRSHGIELETLRGRGYRLTVHEGAAAPVSTPAGPRSRRRAWLPPAAGVAAAGVAAVGLLGFVVLSSLGPAATPSEEAGRLLERARYLASETGDLQAARAVLDTGRVAFPDIAAMHAEWAQLAVWLGDPEGARAAADRALALDPGSATAVRTQGVLAMESRDWPVAEVSLERALGMDPTDTRSHATLAWLRTIQRRLDEADRLLRRALRVDPLSTTLYYDAGLTYLLMGRFDEATRFCAGVLRFQPRSVWATDCLFDATVLAGRTEDAARWGRRLLELYDATPPPEHVEPARVVAVTEAWRLDRWTEAVDRGAYPFGLALAYAANGERERAIDALHAAAARSRLALLAIAVDPRLASLREHPGFRDLEAKLRLPG